MEVTIAYELTGLFSKSSANMENQTYKEISNIFIRSMNLKTRPIAVIFSDEKPGGAAFYKGTSAGCTIPLLKVIEQGRSVALDAFTYGCPGAGYYLGFRERISRDIDYFLSCGKPGDIEGEGFKKTPGLARSFVAGISPVKVPKRYLIFKAMEDVSEAEEIEVGIFLVDPDRLSALVVLANYGRPGRFEVIAPFTSGCGSLVTEPLTQAKEPYPKGVIGLFDVAARRHVAPGILSFAAPRALLLEMAANIKGSFLEKEPWVTMRNRDSGTG